MSASVLQRPFPFLANPPAASSPPLNLNNNSPTKLKSKHRPQPISTHRPQSNAYRTFRRRSSTSCSTTSPACLSPVTPRTPHTPRTPSAAIAAAAAAPATVFGSHSYHPRTRSKSQVQFVSPPSPPHRKSPRGSPRRRRASPPSSPFAPPSPIRGHHHRARADSVVVVLSPVAPLPSTPTPPTPTSRRRLPKLTKIRSLTHLRGGAAATAQPPLPMTPNNARKNSSPAMTTTTSTTTTTMITTVSHASSTNNNAAAGGKRAKRSATPAKNSQVFQKYRPMPFVQQMQILQFMEGGTLESHIQRHHAQAVPSGAVSAGAPHIRVDGGHAPGAGGERRRRREGGAGVVQKSEQGRNGEEIVHGYAFTDERGMIWFDEEEEWEFACLIPKVQRERYHQRSNAKSAGKFLRMLGGANKKRMNDDDDDECEGWERFGSGSSDEDVDEAVDERAGWVMSDEEDGDDLRSFGGDVAVRRPEQSVLKTSKPRPKGKQRRKRSSSGPKPRPSTAPASTTATTTPTPPSHRRPKPKSIDTRSVQQEFFSASFVPSPTTIKKHVPTESERKSSSRSAAPPPTTPSLTPKPSLSALPGMFKRHRHPHRRSVSQQQFNVTLPVSVSTPTVNNLNVPHSKTTAKKTATGGGAKPYAKSANPSAVSLVLPPMVANDDDNAVQWAWTEIPKPVVAATGSKTRGRPATAGATGGDRSVALPTAAAKRLGMQGVESVSLEPVVTKKKGHLMGLWGRK